MRAPDLRRAPPPGRAPAPPPRDRRARSTTSPRSPTAASRSCPSRARATSGSTSRATRGSSRRAGSSTSSAGSSSTRTASRATSASGRATATPRRPGFERFVDHVVERRRRFPGMHVYHYAPYERTALSRLMGEHATREDEIDDLLRGEVLVDLFRVTKQALRASVPWYSIKEVEKLYGFERTAEVGGGGESVNDFETWLETGEESLLDGIRDYNREDCVSLFELHRWLLGRRPAELPWRLPPDERERERGGGGARAERERVRDALLAGAEEGDPRLAARAPPRLPPARGEAAVVGVLPPPRARRGGARRRRRHARRARARRRAVRSSSRSSTRSVPGAGAQDRRTGRRSGDRARATTSRSTTSTGRCTLRRGPRAAPTSRCRRALIPPKPLPTWTQRDGVLRFAKKRERYPALVEILERRPPRARLDGTLDRGGAQPRRELPLRPGPARLGEDVERRAAWRSRSCGRAGASA